MRNAKASLQGCFLPVVYEDHRILVLHKSSGTPSLPLSEEEDSTAVNSAIAYFPALASLNEGGLVHRLDTGTSGLLVFAKTASDQEWFVRIWRKKKPSPDNPKVRKVYRCLLINSASQPHIPRTITTPLGHDAKSKKKMKSLPQFEGPEARKWAEMDPKKLQNRLGIRGKILPAITHLKKVWARNSISTCGSNYEIWDAEVEIETGVMHQIRCHLASQNLPILGDPLYRGRQKGNFPLPNPGDIGIENRLWLHAWKLEIPYPDARVIEIQSALPWKPF